MASTAQPKRPRDESQMTPGEVAATFGVSPKTVGRWGDAHKLTVQRTLGGHRRYVAAEIRALAAKLKAPAEVAEATS